MLLRDKGLQSSLQKIVTFMFQALVLVHNIVTSVWYIYFCCTAPCSLLLSYYSIVTHSIAGNCHFDVSGLRCSEMYAKSAKNMAFYTKRGQNLLDVFMTNYTSIYYEKANSCCFYVVNSKKPLFYV